MKQMFQKSSVIIMMIVMGIITSSQRTVVVLAPVGRETVSSKAANKATDKKASQKKSVITVWKRQEESGTAQAATGQAVTLAGGVHASSDHQSEVSQLSDAVSDWNEVTGKVEQSEMEPLADLQTEMEEARKEAEGQQLEEEKQKILEEQKQQEQEKKALERQRREERKRLLEQKKQERRRKKLLQRKREREREQRRKNRRQEKIVSCCGKVRGTNSQQILERIVEAEAGGEDYKGKLLVANVVLNRVLSSQFPDTVRGVVFAHNQFSPVSDGRYYSVKVSSGTRKAVKAALQGEDPSQGAVYFMERSLADQDNASWFDRCLTKLFRYGCHEFYK